MTLYTQIPSPVGPLTLTSNGKALTSLWFDKQEQSRDLSFWRRDDAAFAQVLRELAEYFAGERQEFTVELAPQGTPFQQRVWAALREIPYGETTSYGEIARRLGDANAMRAVGTANGRNPISVIVPCHRVIGADGSMTGYGGGIDRKRWLLGHEARFATTTLFG